jgi:hypothetical protein
MGAVSELLRLSDWLALARSRVPQGKRGAKRQSYPGYEAAEFLDQILAKHTGKDLTRSKKRDESVEYVKTILRIANPTQHWYRLSERYLHFNDLRGTAATKFYIAGFTMREIAETLTWEEESVEKIIRRYVGRAATLKARIRKLETQRVNTFSKTSNKTLPPNSAKYWSGRRESNPRMQLGKLPFYH